MNFLPHSFPCQYENVFKGPEQSLKQRSIQTLEWCALSYCYMECSDNTSLGIHLSFGNIQVYSFSLVSEKRKVNHFIFTRNESLVGRRHEYPYLTLSPSRPLLHLQLYTDLNRHNSVQHIACEWQVKLARQGHETELIISYFLPKVSRSVRIPVCKIRVFF